MSSGIDSPHPSSPQFGSAQAPGLALAKVMLETKSDEEEVEEEEEEEEEEDIGFLFFAAAVEGMSSYRADQRPSEAAHNFFGAQAARKQGWWRGLEISRYRRAGREGNNRTTNNWRRFAVPSENRILN